MQGISEKFTQGIDFAKNKIGDIKDALSDNPTLAAMLMAGGGAGLAGGLLTHKEKEEQDETPAQRRMRILRNALIAGTAGAGAVGLGVEGYKRFQTAIPEGSPNPVTEKLTSMPVRGAGALAGMLAGMRRGAKGDYQDVAVHAHKTLERDGGYKPSVLAKMTPDNKITASNALQGPPSVPLSFSSPVDKLVNKSEPWLQDKANNFYGRGLLHRPADAVWHAAPKIKSLLRTILGHGRQAQLARVGLGVGAFAPEMISGAKNLMFSGDE